MNRPALDGYFAQKAKILGFSIQNINGIDVITPPLVLIPPGDFVMGSEVAYDPDASSSEAPRHRVRTTAYSIAQFPVTVAEYACFVRDGGPEPETRGHVTWDMQLHHLDHPVVCVRWIDATSYISWLSRLTNQPWRLPTEAEWEKAASWDASKGKGQARIYPWGNKFDSKRCNTNASKINTTTPVDHYPQGVSPYNVWDMAGNVWEWTSSAFKAYPYDTTDGREEPASLLNRVLRGGAWLLDPVVARTTCRNNENPDKFAGYFYDVGFRLLLEQTS